jgi:hypothetical protein
MMNEEAPVLAHLQLSNTVVESHFFTPDFRLQFRHFFYRMQALSFFYNEFFVIAIGGVVECSGTRFNVPVVNISLHILLDAPVFGKGGMNAFYCYPHHIRR